MSPDGPTPRRTPRSPRCGTASCRCSSKNSRPKKCAVPRADVAREAKQTASRISRPRTARVKSARSARSRHGADQCVSSAPGLPRRSRPPPTRAPSLPLRSTIPTSAERANIAAQSPLPPTAWMPATRAARASIRPSSNCSRWCWNASILRPPPKWRVRIWRAISAAWSPICWPKRTIQLNAAERQEVVKQLLDDMLGLGPLEPLLADETISEIMVNGPKQVYIENKGKLMLVRRAIPRQCACAGRRDAHCHGHRPPHR